MAITFTYSYLIELYDCLKDQGRVFSRFSDPPDHDKKQVYLRHDIDVSLHRASEMAELDAKHEVNATFFFMVDNDIYNLYSTTHQQIIKRIIQLGHDVGLHFMPKYEDLDSLNKQLKRETFLLSSLLDYPVSSFSVHRPSPNFLNSEFQLGDLVNTYNPAYYGPEKYITDSNQHFRCGDPLAFIKQFEGPILQIVIHPIWWSEQGQTLEQKLMKIVEETKKNTIDYLKNNIKSASKIF